MRIKAIVNRNDPRQNNYIQYLERMFPQLMDEKDPELYYVIGGDGAMLHAHSKYDSGHPYFGKGLGTLNFIMNNFEEDTHIIENMLDGYLTPEILKLIRLEVTIETKGMKIVKHAINDIIIGNSMVDWHEFNITSERKTFDHLSLKGMGLCISTPLGSTAFNLNNNGNVLPLDSDLLSITGIVCDHNISEILTSQRVEITINSLRAKPTIFIDGGTNAITLDKGDKIKISPIQPPFRLAFLDRTVFFSKRRVLIQNKR